MCVLKISELNKGWGICGFASSLGALYETGTLKGTIDAAVQKGHLSTRLLAEIKTYLVILKSENQILLLNEIKRFTKSFAGFAGFTIDKYIAKVNTIATTAPNLADKDFSIAMPANAVLDYLKRIGEKKSARIVASNRVLYPNNVILGLCDTRKASNEWKGLGHWVYKKSASEIYNWGEKESETELMSHNSNWVIGYQILVG